MLGLDRGVMVTVTSTQTHPRNCANIANARPDSLQADYAQVAVNNLSHANASGFFALVAFGNLLSRTAGAVYALAEIRRRRGKIGQVTVKIHNMFYGVTEATSIPSISLLPLYPPHYHFLPFFPSPLSRPAILPSDTPLTVSLLSSSPSQQFISCSQHCTLRTPSPLISLLPTLSSTLPPLNLIAFSTDAASKLHVLGHDCNPLGMDGAEVAVLKEAHMIGLGGLLEGKQHSCLYP